MRVAECDAVFYCTVISEFIYQSPCQDGQRYERRRHGGGGGMQPFRGSDNGAVGALVSPIDSPGGEAELLGDGVGVDGVGRQEEVSAQPQRGGHHDDDRHRERTLEREHAAWIGDVGIAGQHLR